jgi:2-C-methyl-D-erythritol 4-phosphate cytidylyltransferase
MDDPAAPHAPLALVAAGGDGRRLGADVPKALVRCGGRTLLAWSLRSLAAASSFAEGGSVVVAAHASELDAFEAEVEPFRQDGLRIAVCVGGPSRSHSVRNALVAAGAIDRFSAALVHDAARPLAGPELIDACVAGIAGGLIDALIPAAPITDTVKQADADGVVTATLDRRTLWAVQTPQAFTPRALAAALKIESTADDAELASATDEASLVEAAGGTVKILPWLAPNPKVTTAGDLERVAAMLAAA